ncbi:MAG: S-malonyltransferase [Oscillospiraceae bacterium]|jgi:[acyl-carrier-protein] S-malonyltransferase|nr:S-malonyltransferase [Oscillospiraceae bacterium]
MGKIAFLFAGQGAQYSGMGKSLYETSPAARHVFDLADTIRPETSSQCFEGSTEELSVTLNTQPCLFCVDLAAAEAVRESGITPDGVAGFSLGEVAALTFAGGFSTENGFKLVCERAALMHEASEASQSGMVAILKLAPEKVAEICAQVGDSYPINFNCPGQIVAATLRDRSDELIAAVKQAGGRALALPVSGGFHSPFMQSAYEGLQKALEHYAFAQPLVPVYANSTASPYVTPDKQLLSEQLIRPVYWQKTLETMAADGYDTFVEVGAGKTLSGFVKKTLPDATVVNVQDAESLAAALAVLRGE